LIERIVLMLPKTVIYYGSREEIPEPIALVAGPVRMQFEPLTGLVAVYPNWRTTKLWRAIYAAVRDQNWATIPPRLSNIERRLEKNSFGLSFDVECGQGQVDYFWRGKSW